MSKGKSVLKPEEYYVKLTNQMIDHAAWRGLSGNAIKIYLQMRRVSFSTPNRFFMKYNDMAKLKIHRRHMKPSITELMDFGFIELVEHGGWDESKWSLNYYKMSDRWKQCTDTFRPGAKVDPIEQARTKDFYRVPPVEPVLVPLVEPIASTNGGTSASTNGGTSKGQISPSIWDCASTTGGTH